MSLRELEKMVGARMANASEPTADLIRQTITFLREGMFQTVTNDEAEKLARVLEERQGISMSLGAQLVHPDFQPWLIQRKSQIDPFYWDRYRDLLINQGFPPGVMATLDQDTDNIVGLLEDPKKEGNWDRRGMVVGHVQSGKTANYTGVICKAADVGYRLIIVIAGVHNNLRSQTQQRIDEGFIGRDTGKGLVLEGQHNAIGVGVLKPGRKPASFTNTHRDFNKLQASTVGVSIDNLREPAVLVIKKNSSTLKNLIGWLKDLNAKRHSETISAPMLLIDDEADNASINTAKGVGEVTKINGQIRTLLKMFERSCYVGYTATPFANIFIDPDSDQEMLGSDLFPKHFIISLNPPDNYFGAKRVFLDAADEIIRDVGDNEDHIPVKHKKDHVIAGLPASLDDAIRCFVLSRAVRILRGDGTKHSSMLINTSRFTDVQGRIRNEVHERIRQIASSVKVFGNLDESRALSDHQIAKLKIVWDKEYYQTGFEWVDIQKALHEAASPIQVVEVNSRSKGGLDYKGNSESGLHVIAVGGFSLSRGLTLEGLVVSYFLRNSMMYDTLMQMGRWFGYRPNYEDLCRIWMSEEAQGWYEHIAEATDELRAELKAMEAANATPEEFGLKVRSHPDTLIVTARNKMGTGKQITMQIGLGQSLIETSILKGDLRSIEENRRAAQRFSDELKAIGCDLAGAEKVSGGYLVRNVAYEPIVNFVRAFRNSEGSLKTDGRPVATYIEDRAQGELADWDVLLASIKDGKSDLIDDKLLGRPIECQERVMGDRSGEQTIYVTNKQRVASRGIERAGLSEVEITAAESTYLEADRLSKKDVQVGKKANFPDYIYRNVRKKPLLIVHLLRLKPSKNQSPPDDLPVVAWSISFPRTDVPENKVTYVVGAVWLKENQEREFEWQDDELGGDDE